MGFDEGYAFGKELAARRIARKDALTDEQHADQRDKYIAAGKAYQVQLSSYKNDKGEVIPEYADQYKKVSDLSTQNEYNLGQLYDPIKAPGRLQADWHYLRERIHGIKQPTPTPTQSPAFTIPAPPPAPITTPEMPAYQQTTPGLPSQGGGVTTTVPGVAATTMPGMASAPIAMPAVSLPKVTKMPWAQGQVQKLKDAAMAKAKQQADLLEAGAPLSPQQQAQVETRTADTLLQLKLKAIEANPMLTPEEKADMRKLTLAGSEKPVPESIKTFTLKLKDGSEIPVLKDMRGNGRVMYLNNSPVPDEVLEGATIAAKTVAPKGYSYVPTTGMVKDGDTGKLYSVEDIGKPGVPTGILPIFQGAKAQMDEKQKNALALAVVRQNAYMKEMVDPNDNTKMIWATPAQAKGQEAPNSVSQKLLNPTASERQRADFAISAHDQLKDMGDILSSRDDLFGPLSGRYTNFTQWVGSQDPDAQRFRVAARVLSDHAMAVFGARSQYASESIYDLVGQNATNPTAGAAGLKQLDKALEVIGSRGSGAITPGSGAALLGNGPKSKGSRSLAASMAKPFNKGKSADEVQKHLESLGYTVTKP
jgi:hypothetical protein